MANRTDVLARSVHGTNPQFLLGKIVRAKVYDSDYWKEHCFGLSAASILDKAAGLTHIGGTVGAWREPTPFLCLVTKLLQIQPKKEVVLQYINNEAFKYLTALGVFYFRLVGSGPDVYRALEPLLADFRKLRIRAADGAVAVTHMDEFVDACLRDPVVLGVDLPALPLRRVLEETGRLPPRTSALNVESMPDRDAAKVEKQSPRPKQDREGAGPGAPRESDAHAAAG